jgi:hypothetical protein
LERGFGKMKGMTKEIIKQIIEKYKKFILVGFGVLLLVFAGIAYYFYSQNLILKDPQKAAKKEMQEIVALVGKLIILPEDETPTVATVKDPEKLKDQLFFANAKAGDKVLIYTNAQKAILYDPIQNKIIEVAPLNIGDQ